MYKTIDYRTKRLLSGSWKRWQTVSACGKGLEAVEWQLRMTLVDMKLQSTWFEGLEEVW